MKTAPTRRGASPVTRLLPVFSSISIVTGSPLATASPMGSRELACGSHARKPWSLGQKKTRKLYAPKAGAKTNGCHTSQRKACNACVFGPRRDHRNAAGLGRGRLEVLLLLRLLLDGPIGQPWPWPEHQRQRARVRLGQRVLERKLEKGNLKDARRKPMANIGAR